MPPKASEELAVLQAILHELQAHRLLLEDIQQRQAYQASRADEESVHG